MISSLLAFGLVQLAVLDTEHTFVFRAPAGAKSVHLAGSFNDWRTDQQPMEKLADGTFRVRLKLPFGRYTYKFVVDGRDWHTDPNAKSEDDGSGNTNSILLMVPAEYGIAASPDDSAIAASVLKHEAAAPWVNLDRGKLGIRLRARPNDLRRAVVVAGGREYPMRPDGDDELFRTYQAEVPWNRRQKLNYSFRLVSGERKLDFGAFTIDPKTYQPFEVPAWPEKTILYQIFPDRFENGNRANDPVDVVSWDAKPTWYNFYGGDFAGIDRRIPYLKDLGVGAIYFNPIFRAPSNHRYDADSYLEVDPKLGTNAEFVDLNRKLQQNGIRTILDFAYNHTAPGFFAFQDILKNQEKSRYTDWYFVHRYPVEVKMPPNYDGWWGFSGMPKLNVKNPQVRDHLLNVTRYWVHEVGIDGMRLDVPNEVDSSFWRIMRPIVKRSPSKWILGEIWEDGRPWLQGDQFDSVMNYPFRTACVKFIAEGSETPSQFVDRLMRVESLYVPQVRRNLMNLLTSHDTERFLTLAGGNRSLQKLAATVQLTWVGTPSIYYGEELGMEGGKDPDNRRGMRWDLLGATGGLFDHYRKLAQVRNRSKALQSGDPAVLLADDSARTLVFARTLDREAVLTVVNRSDRTQTISFKVPSGTAFTDARRSGLVDVLSGRPCRAAGDTVSLSLGPLESAVLLSANRAASHLAHMGHYRHASSRSQL